MSATNPGITRSMTGLLERARPRRTPTALSSSSTTSLSSLASVSTPVAAPVSKLKPKVNDLLAERSQLQADLEKAANDFKVSEKQKADAEGQSQEILQQLTKEREISKALRRERDNAVTDAEASRKAAFEVDERAKESRKAALEAEQRAARAEKADKDSQLAREKLEKGLKETERLKEEMSERVKRVEKELAETEQARMVALKEAESLRGSLTQALQLGVQYQDGQLTIQKLDNDLREAKRVAEEVQGKLEKEEKVSRELRKEKEARKKAEDSSCVIA
ncbi:hypothetical protein BDP27DRAFT_1423973 [Rhodocollybia butyracea]|uniref:Uncharacterized protein n=1 Tax=Rhodocollybia butyracea TaxID=206335 RepID=A0A9P5U605_9AGAR|nr:hypothetical protein BDP27DRAFT_1423973 [Rhodocollybia butyracea]